MTIRTKLTALFSALFILLAAVLVATSYAFVARTSTPQAQQQARVEAIASALRESGFDVGDMRMGAGMDGGRGRVAQTLEAIDVQTRGQLLDAYLVRSLFAFVLVAAIAIPIAYWLSGRVLRPVADITRAANALSESTLDSRLPATGVDDEFGRLSTSFNGMLARLQRSFDSRQRFAADASHELRTPLAVMGASADNVLAQPRAAASARDLATTVRAEVDRSESLISSLLALARADDVTHTRDALDLADVAADAVAGLTAAADAAGVRVELELADAPVLADRVLVTRAVANLVENAIRYNVPDGWVACRVDSGTGQARVIVSNSGPVVSAGEVDHLFERFMRGERSEATGHGLGLAIVAKVAEVHGGAIAAEPRANGGLDLTLTLPLRVDPTPASERETGT